MTSLTSLPLRACGVVALGPTSSAPFVVRIAGDASAPSTDDALLVRGAATAPRGLATGFRAYLTEDEEGVRQRDVYRLPRGTVEQLALGDVVRIDPRRGVLSVLYRRSSRHNSLLLTERCNNRCLMCSQPPRAENDECLLEEAAQVIRLMDPETAEVGLTGGEPGLLGLRLVDLVRLLHQRLPGTAVHILSNGRAFRDRALAQALADVGHPDLMVGVPLYAEVDAEHDFIVQSRGAFEDTVRGIIALKKVRVAVEIRIVIVNDNAEHLPELAEFIAWNLRFVDHVALMGLEPVGLAEANIQQVWADPVDYRAELVRAVRILRRAGIATSIYNHQLCVLAREVHPFARRSISDWKVMYLEECHFCERREECCGIFTSATARRSRGVAPMLAGPMEPRREIG